MPSYYDILGVSEDAESEEIEAAFRRALASAQSEAKKTKPQMSPPACGC